MNARGPVMGELLPLFGAVRGGILEPRTCRKGWGAWEESLSLASPLVSTHVVLYRSKASEAGEAEKTTVTSIFQGEETQAQRR